MTLAGYRFEVLEKIGRDVVVGETKLVGHVAEKGFLILRPQGILQHDDSEQGAPLIDGILEGVQPIRSRK